MEMPTTGWWRRETRTTAVTLAPFRPMISKLLQKIGIKTALSKNLPSLTDEGIVFRQDDTWATLKFGTFSGPGVHFTNKTKITLCNIIVSKSRIYACGWFFKIINIPYSKNNIHLFSVSQNNQQISISIQAETFGDKYRGDFSMSFSTNDATDLAKYFNSIKNVK